MNQQDDPDNTPSRARFFHSRRSTGWCTSARTSQALTEVRLAAQQFWRTKCRRQGAPAMSQNPPWRAKYVCTEVLGVVSRRNGVSSGPRIQDCVHFIFPLPITLPKCREKVKFMASPFLLINFQIQYLTPKPVFSTSGLGGLPLAFPILHFSCTFSDSQHNTSFSPV